MKVKVCGMRYDGNIVQIARFKPDFMGFIFYDRSPRYAGDITAETLDILPNETKRVGVFVDAPEDYIRATAVKYKLDYVQLHGSEPPAVCNSLRRDFKVIKAFGISTATDFEQITAYETTCDLYVFDTKTPTHGGSGRKFDHSLLSIYKGGTPYLLSGGISPDDAQLEGAFANSLCVGFDINSRFETQPGMKDTAMVKKFIETIKGQNMNRIDKLFAEKKHGIFSVYFTAGYPNFDDTVSIITELAERGVDMIEVGIPFSDPMADGPVIQQSSTVSLNNGMTLKKLFGQLAGIRETISIPLVMMGYLNPIMQYGIEEFCKSCVEVGIDGVVIPDLPFADYLRDFKPVIEKYGLHCIMLITPETSTERIRLIDENTSGFIYMVSTASTTGARDSFDQLTLDYFDKVNAMQLHNPRMIGFGISNKITFDAASQYAAGVIIGSAFVRLLGEQPTVKEAVAKFVEQVKRS